MARSRHRQASELEVTNNLGCMCLKDGSKLKNQEKIPTEHAKSTQAGHSADLCSCTLFVFCCEGTVLPHSGVAEFNI